MPGDRPPGPPLPEGPGVVYGLYVPNAPNLISPEAFGGVGSETVRRLEGIDLVGRVHPDVILVSTPHFETHGTLTVQASPRPPCLHDFGGMPALERFRYEPPGDPELARVLAEAGRRAGVPVETTLGWGLDHGAWAPLRHLIPAADVPVVPLSISDAPPETHLRWGAAIRQAVLGSGRRAAFVATGSILHRLDRARFGPTPEWGPGARLEAEVVEALLREGAEGLRTFDREKWAELAPEGGLLPLYTLLGAVGPGPHARLVGTAQAFGAAGMSVLEFVPAAPVTTPSSGALPKGAHPRA
jgi:4,5-DOPA dioxygenase extradiol